jgi:hypothetical protein
VVRAAEQMSAIGNVWFRRQQKILHICGQKFVRSHHTVRGARRGEIYRDELGLVLGMSGLSPGRASCVSEGRLTRMLREPYDQPATWIPAK